MNINWIYEDISGPMDTRSSIVKPSIHVPLGDKVTSKQPPKVTQWEGLNKIWGGNQVNDM